MTVIQFHDTLHGFQACRDTGTASLESKLLQQLMEMREQVFYEIYLYMHQAYYALDRVCCLDILESYGVGPWDISLL